MTIETVLHFGQIAVDILGELEMMIGARDSGPQVGGDGIDPAEFRVRRDFVSAGTDHDGLVFGEVAAECVKAVQRIR